MKIIKRNGSEAVFDITKIIAALNKANAAVPENARMDQEQILGIAATIDRVVHIQDGQIVSDGSRIPDSV